MKPSCVVAGGLAPKYHRKMRCHWLILLWKSLVKYLRVNYQLQILKQQSNTRWVATSAARRRLAVPRQGIANAISLTAILKTTTKSQNVSGRSTSSALSMSLCKCSQVMSGDLVHLAVLAKRLVLSCKHVCLRYGVISYTLLTRFNA